MFVEWRQAYADCCKHFVHKTLTELQTLGPDPENIRIVFFFDN